MERAYFFFVLITIFISCKKENFNQDINSTSDTLLIHNNEIEPSVDSLEIQRELQQKEDSIAQVQKEQEEQKKRKSNSKYHIEKGNTFDYWPIKSSDSLQKLFYHTFSKEEQYVIAALNRIDTDHIKRKDTLIVPQNVTTDFLSYAPFPNHLALLDSIGKIAIFSYPVQAYALYENGKLIKWGPTNMGKKTAQTPRGLFFTNWKGRKVQSTANDEWILNWNFNISNSGGVGWHQYALPGYPASHSCLRLLDADAQMMYNWADQWVLADKNTVKVKGTPVIVYGDYAFGKKGIWHQLPVNPDVTKISEAELNEIVRPHLMEIYKQQEIRAEYLSSRISSSSNDSLKGAY